MAEKIEPQDGAMDGSASAELTKGLEVLDSEWEEMDLGDGKANIVVGPMKMGQIRAFMKEAAALLPYLQNAIRNPVSGGIELDAQAMADIDQDAFYRAIAIAADISMERLDGLMPDAFARLLAKVLAVNMDFFAQKLPHVLEGAAQRVGAAWRRLAMAGTTQSRSSSSTGTP